MKNMSHHTEWLSLIEVSGPFLSVSVLDRIFPQGLESLDKYSKQRIRSAYEEWRDAIDENDPQLSELHQAWIRLVLEELLEYDGSVLAIASDDLTYKSKDGEGQFKSDFILKSDSDPVPKLLISILPEGTDLEKVKAGDGWPVPVSERMTLLCRDKGVRLGLVTNGERWMLVNAPQGSTSSHISWYARLWFQEMVTLKAFQSLMGIRRWFGPEDEALPSMLEDSLQHHEEVTDTLGEQVKRAVEVLVQCLDKADQDRNRELLHDVPPSELYEAGLTVMMRLVFVLCAEERGLLLLDDLVYDQNYAISTLRGQLAVEADQHGQEVLERKHDAWARLLAVFRAVFEGIEHESLRMPALGGSLFDPDRFPFLEGRGKDTRWQETPAQPLPIDNRTVLLLLEALQVLEQRSGALLLSYKALDVEQIGHVYEGLLDHTVSRLGKNTLGLIGSHKAKNPNIALADLESARLDGEEALISILETTTSRSKSAITNALAKEVDDATFGDIVTVCGGDTELAVRMKPFTHLLRTDAWGDFIIYRADSFAVTLGADRRETGTHYTPKSLTESIVETTLEPVAYLGPAEGKPREEWQLKSSVELLELKICDPAMGSGAFLVQVCRWLSERLVEAWGKETGKGKFITVDGVALNSSGSAEPMPDSLDERLLIARRLVAEKCLYGVDLNPLAVELAKLSIWLITLAKGRPFGFLDHNLRSGDSLLGLHRLEQLTRFNLDADEKTPKKLFAQKVEDQVKEVIGLRKELREVPIRDIRDVQYMERVDQETRQKLENIEHIADAMVGESLASGVNHRAMDKAMDNLSIWAAAYIEGNNETGRKIIAEARKSLSIDLPPGKPPRKPFHWVLEFPEVFEKGGFDGIIGNPPFLGNKKITGILGTAYRTYILVNFIAKGKKGFSDLCAYFFLRTYSLLKQRGTSGLIATDTISQGDTRIVGLESILAAGGIIFNANVSTIWPGKAAVVISQVWIFKGKWTGSFVLNHCEISNGINSLLAQQEDIALEPKRLVLASNNAFNGSNVLGTGFILCEKESNELVRLSPKNNDVIYPYISGKTLNNSPDFSTSEYVICFWDWPLNHELAPKNYDGPIVEDYPDCLRIVEQRVKPERDKKTDKKYREKWWQFARLSKGAYEHTGDSPFILIKARVSPVHAFAFVARGKIYNEKTVIFNGGLYEFSIYQSSIHEAWAINYSPSMGKTGLSYSPAACVVTFPMPLLTGDVADIGDEYYRCRTAVMLSRNNGLTKVHNAVNDEREVSSEIQQLRGCFVNMDRAVAAAYGWSDLDLGHGFHETKQGIRFTISEEARREILQRLLKLNHKRYQEEVAQGLHSKKGMKLAPRKKRIPQSNVENNLNLFS